MRVKIRTLIVDDEPLARQRVRTLLAAEKDIELVGEAGNGRDAVAAVRELRPDLMFLDVQMPLLDGFGVLEALGSEHLPAVVFVTAYDRYAVRAFETHALDYLLKPFDRSRFGKALDRARNQVERDHHADTGKQLRALLADVYSARQPIERLIVKAGGKVSFLRLGEVDYMEAAGNYVRVHVGDEVHLLRETMSHLESRLKGTRFVRIHRSTIVNLDCIRELQPAFHGDFAVILKSGAELTLSRGYRNKLEEHLGTSL
jgi:two-component system, LytTR family, response regulator